MVDGFEVLHDQFADVAALDLGLESLVDVALHGRDQALDLPVTHRPLPACLCQALADLLDRGLIRKATADEVARQLVRAEVAERGAGQVLAAVPWLALPFLVLLGFSLTIMTHNPINPGFSLPRLVWDRYVLETVSWFWMDCLTRSAETGYFLHGLYPESIDQVEGGPWGKDSPSTDPWGRQYRLVTRGHKLLVTGFDRAGQPVPMLILSRSLAWEGSVASTEQFDGPGVILLEDSG